MNPIHRLSCRNKSLAALRHAGAILFLSALVPAVRSQVISYDAFDYPVGASVVSQTGGGGFATNPWLIFGTGNTAVVQAGALTAPIGYGYDTGTSSVLLTPTSNLTLRRAPAASIDLNPVSTGTYYFSLLFSRSDSGDGATGSNEVVSFLSFTNSGGSEMLRFGANSSEGLNLLATTSAGLATQVSVNGTSNAYGLGTSYLAVGKLVLNPSGTNDVMSLSIFPSGADVSQEPASWSVTLTADLSGTATSMNIVANTGVGTLAVDNLYWGNTYSSVVSPIPEPSVTVLTMAGCAGLVALVRRRRSRS